MTRSTITADYTLRPSALADALAGLVEARRPAIVWGPPGCAKSQSARQAVPAGRRPRSCPWATPGGGRFDLAA